MIRPESRSTVQHEMAQEMSSFSGKGKHFSLQVSNASAENLGMLFGLDPSSVVLAESGGVDEAAALSLVPDDDDGKFDVLDDCQACRVDGEERLCRQVAANAWNKPIRRVLAWSVHTWCQQRIILGEKG